MLSPFVPPRSSCFWWLGWTSVSHPKVDPLPAFVLDRLADFRSPSVLLPYLCGWPSSAQHPSKHGRVDDERTRKVSDMLYQNLHLAVSSTSQLCRAAGVSDKAVRTREGRLASAMLLCQQMEHRSLEQALHEARKEGIRLQMMCEFARYDVTPMKVKAASREDSR